MIRARLLCEEKCNAQVKEEKPHKAEIEFAFKGDKGDDGNGIAGAVLNEDYTLTLKFTDGTEFTTPIPIRGKDGEKGSRGIGIVETIWNDNGTITYVYDDGSAWTTPESVKGEPGTPGGKGDTGNGISSAYLNPETYTLTLTYTNGQSYTTPPIRGEKGDIGATGVGIANTKWNTDGTITYTYSNGSTFTTPYLKGEPGQPGTPGEDGKPGQRGIGIKSSRWNADGTVTYTYDDDSTFTTGYLKGEQGEPGQMSPEQIAQLNDAVEKVAQLDEKVDQLELFKFPNANIIGEPLIENGNISRFSANDYLVFPFVVDVKNNPFVITMCFTTGADVNAQQNILDSYFGMALAIQNGRGIMALSSNGTGWDIGLVVGTIPLQPNSTYYAKVSWDGLAYRTALSTDGITYIDDMYAGTTAGLYPTTMYIGASPNIFGAGSAHPFGGTINMNKCSLSVAGLDVWQGMDDAGLSTRADLSLSNLDAEGEKRFTERYTKTEADAKFALKTELPTVPTNVSAFTNDSHYATETFVAEEFARQLALIDGNEVAY